MIKKNDIKKRLKTPRNARYACRNSPSSGLRRRKHKASQIELTNQRFETNHHRTEFSTPPSRNCHCLFDSYDYFIRYIPEVHFVNYGDTNEPYNKLHFKYIGLQPEERYSPIPALFLIHECRVRSFHPFKSIQELPSDFQWADWVITSAAISPDESPHQDNMISANETGGGYDSTRTATGNSPGTEGSPYLEGMYHRKHELGSHNPLSLDRPPAATPNYPSTPSASFSVHPDSHSDSHLTLTAHRLLTVSPPSPRKNISKALAQYGATEDALLSDSLDFLGVEENGDFVSILDDKTKEALWRGWSRLNTKKTREKEKERKNKKY
ncbi:hypothetical protein D9758_009991 [Tetrapyrgos nigripes]|uniref:Uncharacterized protein n=1 Tax=Tetrapyrgos nigripes TaxID=182062 RepID=A0A8H5CVV7_9AGAR|nr:hypothetical protein D9758_009991 [Tetrapyrgos nigripes]